jgi:membrane protein
VSRWWEKGVRRGKERIEGVRARLLRRPFIRFVYNVIRALGRDYAGIMAAGLSYYAFLSLFPLTIGLISILGFLLPSKNVYTVIFNFLSQNIPASTDVLQSAIRDIIQMRGTLGVISIIGLLVGGSGVLSAISLAINRAWGLFPRPIYIRKPQEIAMVLAIGLIILLLLGLTTGLSFLSSIALPGVSILQFFLARAISFVLVLAIFLLLYRFIPNTRVHWRDIWRGTLITGIIFQLALYGFTYYLQNFASYQMIYGPLSSLVVILVWIYISSFLLILGAEINAVYNERFQPRR